MVSGTLGHQGAQDWRTTRWTVCFSIGGGRERRERGEEERIKCKGRVEMKVGYCD